MTRDTFNGRLSALVIQDYSPAHFKRTLPRGVGVAYAIACGLLPVGIFFLMRKEMAFGMLVMHFVPMLFLPAIHMTIFYGGSRFADYKQIAIREVQSFFTVKFRIAWACGMVIVVAPMVCILFQLLKCSTIRWGLCYEKLLYKNVGFDFGNDAMFAIVGAYFAFVNPVIEELFWRVWVHSEVAGVAFSENVPEHLPLLGSGSSASESVWIDKLEPPISEFGKIFCCAIYASYHFVVVWKFTNSIAYGVMATILMFAFGRLCIWFRSRRSWGISAAIAAHMGIDLGIALGIALEHYHVFSL